MFCTTTTATHIADVSESARRQRKAWGTGCAFVDYDRDGKLDLIVANYVDYESATALPGERPPVWKGVPVMCGPRGLPGENILTTILAMALEDVTTKAY
jgi:hypothetical protein